MLFLLLLCITIDVAWPHDGRELDLILLHVLGRQRRARLVERIAVDRDVVGAARRRVASVALGDAREQHDDADATHDADRNARRQNDRRRRIAEWRRCHHRYVRLVRQCLFVRCDSCRRDCCRCCWCRHRRRRRRRRSRRLARRRCSCRRNRCRHRWCQC
jgi:hypothetical protein